MFPKMLLDYLKYEVVWQLVNSFRYTLHQPVFPSSQTNSHAHSPFDRDGFDPDRDSGKEGEA